jgi:hypothetical protein
MVLLILEAAHIIDGTLTVCNLVTYSTIHINTVNMTPANVIGFSN